ncbi:hypothetical protein H4Q26_003993 [Puccinia striiformis f. sp. tritici PST-130]|nr:hypothetical protein H4Q26_003993 [Puccinia striiformis f. sp. tritici PST-130]
MAMALAMIQNVPHGNYALIVAALAVYSLLTNPLLLISIGFLVGGFGCIQRFGPDPNMPAEGQMVTQKSLYITLFVIGIPMLWIAAPIATAMWLVGSSAVTVWAMLHFLNLVLNQNIHLYNKYEERIGQNKKQSIILLTSRVQ